MLEANYSIEKYFINYNLCQLDKSSKNKKNYLINIESGSNNASHQFIAKALENKETDSTLC